MSSRPSPLPQGITAPGRASAALKGGAGHRYTMSGVLALLARRWVAGEDIPAAVAAAAQARSRGIIPILDYLGEHVTVPLRATEARDTYLRLARALREAGMEARLSLKLSQLGLQVGKGFCYQHVLSILGKADMVWVDMEAPARVQDTVDLFRDFRETHPGQVGLCLQANLRRTRQDLLALAKEGARIRLVKGAYPGDVLDPEGVAHQFSRLLRLLFRYGDHFAVATTDARLIEEAVLLQARKERDLQFQFLRGVCAREKASLLAEGFAVGEYIPFGTTILPYAWRRIKDPRRLLQLFK